MNDLKINVNDYNSIIIGAGVTGAVIARRLSEKGEKVIIIDKRDHIAGNLYDYKNKGITIHKYGPHIFQSSDKEVIDFVKKYSDWHVFKHKVNVKIDDKIEVPLPINFKSISKIYGKEKGDKLKVKLLETFDKEVISIFDLIESKNKEINDFGNYIYKNVYVSYTVKMWGIHPNDIDPSVLKRVPIYLSNYDSYFKDEFQAIPTKGYTSFVNSIIGKNKVIKGIDMTKYISFKNNNIYIKNKIFKGKIFWTGAIDDLFLGKYGVLPYRSLEFTFEYLKTDNYQKRSVVNYPNHPTMTRITEYKKLCFENDKKGTIIGKEFPGEYKQNGLWWNIRYYPINNEKNIDLYNKYLKEAMKYKNLYLIGRLANYRYIQMAQAIKNALNLNID